MSMPYITNEICEQPVVGIRGDYLAFRIEINAPDCPAEINLASYSYDAQVWSQTRAIDPTNPAGGIVLIEKQTDFGVELLQDEGAIVLTLDADQTSLLKPDEEYRWFLKWFITRPSIKTIANGPLKVR